MEHNRISIEAGCVDRMLAYKDDSDTIAAVSTPPGRGGIGIIRISGASAFEITARIYKGKTPFQKLADRRIAVGRIVDPRSGDAIDDVVVVKMKGPASYTGEDTAEIDCHGSPVVLKKVLELAIDSGARLAEPGEFSKRAFINGRLDLAQAEAVADLISSMTSLGAKTALQQLEGNLSQRIAAIKNRLVSLIADIDASIDYPEHDTENIAAAQVSAALREISLQLSALSAGFEHGRIIREGLGAVIAGRPNVGKSSLFNEFAGKDRAIVAEMPGTTRDTIDEYINISGIPVKVTDTAGIRAEGGEIEKMGVARSMKAVQDADIVILMFDASRGLTAQDLDIFNEIKGVLAQKRQNATGVRIIAIGNKIDLLGQDEGRVRDMLEDADKKLNYDSDVNTNRIPVIGTSMKDGTGFRELIEAIGRISSSCSASTAAASAMEVLAVPDPVLTNIRHKGLVDAASAAIAEALRTFENGMPADCMEIDIRQAVDSLAAITGENADAEIIERIFEKFCIGK